METFRRKIDLVLEELKEKRTYTVLSSVVDPELFGQFGFGS
jgi:hypothetical protein